MYVTVATGDTLILQCVNGATEVTSSGSIIVSETYAGAADTDVVAFAYYEAFLIICQLITDSHSLDSNHVDAGTGNWQPNPFYSTFFGRTYSALQPVTPYGADGTGSL